MNTMNIVLMMVLAAMIGFAIGNIWGKESMRRTLTGLLEQLAKGLMKATGSQENKGE